MMSKFKVTDIAWDTDGADLPHDVPLNTEIEAEDEDAVADALSDKYGWCIASLNIEEIVETVPYSDDHLGINR
jgi:hypothetical protein